MLGQHRSTQRRIPRGRDDEDRLVADMIELARQYGRYGYRRIAALLRDAGWQVNDKRVERLWRREGLKVPTKQPKRGRLWLNDGSCIRLRAERADHVWSYDFVHHRTYDGRAFRMLNVLDEFTRESLAIRVRRKLSSIDVIDVLTDLFILRGIPGYIRSDNGPEFVAEAVRRWITAVGAQTAFIEPGSPWENGYIESLNARLRDELLNGEIFYTLKEAQVLIESWRCHYNAIRPHGSLGYRPPAPEDDHHAKLAARLRYAPPATQLGRKTRNALTFETDQSVGAGQSRTDDRPRDGSDPPRQPQVVPLRKAPPHTSPAPAQTDKGASVAHFCAAATGPTRRFLWSIIPPPLTQLDEWTFAMPVVALHKPLPPTRRPSSD